MHDRPKCLHISAPARITDVGPLSLHKQVQQGLNLALRLKNRTQMPALIATIAGMKPSIDPALEKLNYVHFARFLPSADGSVLYVLTTFDARNEPYIRDFAAVLGDAFTTILHFIRDAPRLPVQKYQDDFWDFVSRNSPDVGLWSAYPDATVLEIRSSLSHHSPPRDGGSDVSRSQ